MLPPSRLEIKFFLGGSLRLPLRPQAQAAVSRESNLRLNIRRVRVRLKTGGRTGTLVAQRGSVLPGEWTHVAAVYDGRAMILYQDGTEVGRQFKRGPIDPGADVPVWIGDNPPTAGSRPWQGLVDDVRVYTRALGPDEIGQLATPGS